MRPAPERLDGADADRRLLDVGGDVALHVLDLTRDAAVLLLEPQRHGEDRHRGRHDEQAEGPVHPQQQHGHRDQLQDVHDEEQQAEP